MTNDERNPILEFCRVVAAHFRSFFRHSSFVIRHSVLEVVGAAIFCCCLPVFAHDPYEITSTLSLYSNRAELHAELEFRAGMQLSGHTEPVETSDAQPRFEVARPTLTKAAAQFFRLSTGNDELKPGSIAVTLGVENHIRFKLSWPALSTNTFSL